MARVLKGRLGLEILRTGRAYGREYAGMTLPDPQDLPKTSAGNSAVRKSITGDSGGGGAASA